MLHRGCDSQNAEPEGCCVSDVCIVYSVALMHVADWASLWPLLFTKMCVDIRLLSRKAKRKKVKSPEIQPNLCVDLFCLYLFPYCFTSLLVCLSSHFPKPPPPWVTS